MEMIVQGLRVKLVNLQIWEGKEATFTESESNRVGNTGKVLRINDSGTTVTVEWDNGHINAYSPHNLEVIDDLKIDDVFLVAEKSLNRLGYTFRRQIIKQVAYSFMLGEEIFPLMREKKLAIQDVGAIVTAVNDAIKGE